MKLSALLEGTGNGTSLEIAGGAPDIAGLTADSRQVKPGYLFAALAGTKANGADFVADALARGAVAVAVPPGVAVEPGPATAVLRTPDTRTFLARAAAAFYGRQPQTMVAVTGTAGKTSVASFTRQIWAAAGHQAAMIGTTGVTAPKRTLYGALTTPDPVALHALLAELADEGVTHAAMEASSHGLDQHRLDGVTLSAGAFTNLGRDHMDYHPTVEDYLAAKLRLFDTLLPRGAPAVVFADDAWSAPVIEAAKRAGLDLRTVGRRGDFLTLKRVEHQRQSQVAEIHAGGSIFEVRLPLAGDFQLSNALCAAGLAIATGVSAERAMKALEQIEGASGRLELVGATEEGAPVYVDYAHKPDALRNVLEAVRPFTTARVVVVFGCGGDRDRGKRPIMGELAAELADVVIVTDDNPRLEDPGEIRAAIMAAATGAIEIADRAEAIAEAVAMLKPGDTLVVAGKGHEQGQTVGDETLPFSDHEQVRTALAARRA